MQNFFGSLNPEVQSAIVITSMLLAFIALMLFAYYFALPAYNRWLDRHLPATCAKCSEAWRNPGVDTITPGVDPIRPIDHYMFVWGVKAYDIHGWLEGLSNALALGPTLLDAVNIIADEEASSCGVQFRSSRKALVKDIVLSLIWMGVASDDAAMAGRDRQRQLMVLQNSSVGELVNKAYANLRELDPDEGWVKIR